MHPLKMGIEFLPKNRYNVFHGMDFCLGAWIWVEKGEKGMKGMGSMGKEGKP